MLFYNCPQNQYRFKNLALGTPTTFCLLRQCLISPYNSCSLLNIVSVISVFCNNTPPKFSEFNCRLSEFFFDNYIGTFGIVTILYVFLVKSNIIYELAIIYIVAGKRIIVLWNFVTKYAAEKHNFYIL